MKPTSYLSQEFSLDVLQCGFRENSLNGPAGTEHVEIDVDLREQFFNVRKSCVSGGVKSLVVKFDDLSQTILVIL